ncbi:C2 domain-containing protein [Forsythia ovata]|uniref:C2 domain-containing protein n=1 Tax=Forsythia ovata TaxID=205694 RepID=A0ABD1W3A3_9LAMI
MHAATTFSCASPPPNASHRRHSMTRQKKMVRGTLEVLLVCAKGIENTDFLCNMDPYVIITCRTQEHKSSVASGKGSDPEWNENFVFALSDDVPELLIKIMDSDGTSEDDFVGEAKIPLAGLFTEGSIPPTAYNVVKDEEYCGEIRVGLRFTPEEGREEERFDAQEENYGGWKVSSY